MSNVALGKSVAEPIRNPEAATDGNVTEYTGRSGFAFFPWPGTLTVDLGTPTNLKAIRLLLWDGRGDGSEALDARGYKYRLLTSSDRKTWKVLFDTDAGQYSGWQVFTFAESTRVQYVRVHGLWNSANSDFHIVQLEAFDDAPPVLALPATLEHEIGLASAATEDGDGLPLSRAVDALANSLERLLAEQPALNAEYFRELLEQLRLQVADMTALDLRVGSVRRQLVNPVARELSQGKKASVWGWRVGLAGFVTTLASLLLYMWDRFLR